MARIDWPTNPERDRLLRDKLKEYSNKLEGNRKRLDCGYKHPELLKQLLKKSNTYMRMTILSDLELRGSLDTEEYSIELVEEGLLNKETLQFFNESCSVIEDYIQTGGANCYKE